MPDAQYASTVECMTQHTHQHHHGGDPRPDDEAGLAELLDLDAAVHAAYLGEVMTWVGRHAPDDPRTVVDLGAGTGTGTLALARQFPDAVVVAIDQSPLMLERLRITAHDQRLDERVRTIEADLDVARPDLSAADVVWAASSMHHFADPDRVLRDVHAALAPGGLLVVVEMDGPPRFLPDDVGMGRPGLERRCHEALAQEHWNAHPNWRPYLEQAGFQIAAQRTFVLGETTPPPVTGRYAQAWLSRVRSAVDGRLAGDDLETLDRILAGEDPGSLLHRPDLAARGSRTAWAARRP